MNILVKEIDALENRCFICKDKMESLKEDKLLCMDCYNILHEIKVNDFKYDFYKDKIKDWIFSNYDVSL